MSSQTIDITAQSDLLDTIVALNIPVSETFSNSLQHLLPSPSIIKGYLLFIGVFLLHFSHAL